MIGAPHRRDLLNPVFTQVGVGCGPHRGQRFVCVIDFSTAPLSVTPPLTTATQALTPGGLSSPAPRPIRSTPVPRGGAAGLPQQSVTFVHPPAQPATPASPALPSGNAYLPNVTPRPVDIANLPPIGYSPAIPAGAQGPAVEPPTTPPTFDPAPAPYTPSQEQTEDEAKPPL